MVQTESLQDGLSTAPLEGVDSHPSSLTAFFSTRNKKQMKYFLLKYDQTMTSLCFTLNCSKSHNHGVSEHLCAPPQWCLSLWPPYFSPYSEWAPLLAQRWHDAKHQPPHIMSSVDYWCYLCCASMKSGEKEELTACHGDNVHFVNKLHCELKAKC